MATKTTDAIELPDDAAGYESAADWPEWTDGDRWTHAGPIEARPMPTYREKAEDLRSTLAHLVNQRHACRLLPMTLATLDARIARLRREVRRAEGLAALLAGLESGSRCRWCWRPIADDPGDAERVCGRCSAN